MKKKFSTGEGDFFIFDTFIVSEIYEGVSFDWNAAQEVIETVYDFHDSREIRVGYLSNRINSYSLYPQDWMKFFKNRHQLSCVAILSEDNTRRSNSMLEKLFIKTKLKNFSDLDRAIAWVKKNSDLTNNRFHMDKKQLKTM